MKYLALFAILFAILFAVSYGTKPSCFVCEDNDSCREDDGDFDVCYTASTSNYCVECAEDQDCAVRYNDTMNPNKVNQTICDKSIFECVECEVDNECPGAVCFNGTCVDCNSDSDCVDSYCVMNVCVGCTDDDDCTEVGDNMYCDGDFECDYNCLSVNYTGADCSASGNDYSFQCDPTKYAYGCVKYSCLNDNTCEEGVSWCDLDGHFESGFMEDAYWSVECVNYNCQNSPILTGNAYCMGKYTDWPPYLQCGDPEWYDDDGCRPLPCDPESYPCSIYNDAFNTASGGTITTNPYSLCAEDGEEYICVLPCSAYNNTWCVDEYGMQTYSCLVADGTCGVKNCGDGCAGGYDCNSVGQCAYNCEDDVLEFGDGLCPGGFSDSPDNYFCQTNGSNTCEPDPCTMKSDCQDGFTCFEGKCVQSCSNNEFGCADMDSNSMDSNPAIAIQWNCNSTSGFCYFNPSTDCFLNYSRPDLNETECNVYEGFVGDYEGVPDYKCLDVDGTATCVANDNCDRANNSDHYCSVKYQSGEGPLLYQCNDNTGDCYMNPGLDCEVVGCGWMVDLAVEMGHICPGWPLQMACGSNGECVKDDIVSCDDNNPCDTSHGYVCSTLQSGEMMYKHMQICVLGCADNDDYCNSLYCSAGDYGEDGYFTFMSEDEGSECVQKYDLICNDNGQCGFVDECQSDTVDDDCNVKRKQDNDTQAKCLDLPFKPNICYIDCESGGESDNGVCETAFSKYFTNSNEIECKSVPEIGLFFCDVNDVNFIRETFAPTSVPTETIVAATETTDDEAADGINILSIFGAITITIFIKSFM